MGGWRAKTKPRRARKESRYAPARLQDGQDPGPSEAAWRRFTPAPAEGHRLAGSLGARLPQRHAQEEDGLARPFGQAVGRPAHLPHPSPVDPHPTPPALLPGRRRCFFQPPRSSIETSQAKREGLVLERIQHLREMTHSTLRWIVSGVVSCE